MPLKEQSKENRRQVVSVTPHVEAIQLDARLEEDSDNQGWTKNQRKKPRQFSTGSKSATRGTFKGVQSTKDLYVGRCDENVEESHIIEYVKSEFGLDRVKCVCISNANASVKSFQITVTEQQCELMLDDTRWPENVRVRKFYNRFQRNNGERK